MKQSARRSPRFPWLATRTAKWVVGCFLALPLLFILNAVVMEFRLPGSGLGPDPGQELVERLGDWAIRMLCFTLAISTLSRLLKVPLLVQHRRTFGLWAFTYVCLHFIGYAVTLAGLDITTIFGDFTKRPYIIFGLIALSLMIPMAITSTRVWRRKLGLNWRRLHRVVYLVAVCAVIHLWLQERASIQETLLYGSILSLLLFERLVRWTIKLVQQKNYVASTK